mgnify:CR=1 FL=1
MLKLQIQRRTHIGRSDHSLQFQKITEILNLEVLLWQIRCLSNSVLEQVTEDKASSYPLLECWPRIKLSQCKLFSKCRWRRAKASCSRSHWNRWKTIWQWVWTPHQWLSIIDQITSIVNSCWILIEGLTPKKSQRLSHGHSKVKQKWRCIKVLKRIRRRHLSFCKITNQRSRLIIVKLKTLSNLLQEPSWEFRNHPLPPCSSPKSLTTVQAQVSNTHIWKNRREGMM